MEEIPEVRANTEKEEIPELVTSEEPKKHDRVKILMLSNMCCPPSFLFYIEKLEGCIGLRSDGEVITLKEAEEAWKLYYPHAVPKPEVADHQSLSFFKLFMIFPTLEQNKVTIEYLFCNTREVDGNEKTDIIHEMIKGEKPKGLKFDMSNGIPKTGKTLAETLREMVIGKKEDSSESEDEDEVANLRRDLEYTRMQNDNLHHIIENLSKAVQVSTCSNHALISNIL